MNEGSEPYVERARDGASGTRAAAHRRATGARDRHGAALLQGVKLGGCLVLALLAAPADAAAAECGGSRRCRCGDQVVADYVLTEDLGPCDDRGLRVRRRVVLDGNGHLVRGSGRAGSVGIQIDSKASGTVLRDVAVTGFERGIRLVKVERVRVEGVAAHGNGDPERHVGYGIDLAGGASRNVLARVQVFDNADEGIHVGSGAHENQIVDAQVYDNFRENVYFLRNHGNVLARSELRGAGAAVYIKHASRTVLEGNRIDGAVVHLRGATRDTSLIDNQMNGSALVLQRYRDKDPKIGVAAPATTTVRGGRIRGDGACVRVEGATATVLERVELACPTQVSLDGAGDVRAVATRIDEVRCAGDGRLERARAVDVRFVDAAGAPVAGAELRRADGGAPAGVANAKGIYSGLVVESLVECPGGTAKDGPPLVVHGGGRSRRVPLVELRGDVPL